MNPAVTIGVRMCFPNYTLESQNKSYLNMSKSYMKSFILKLKARRDMAICLGWKILCA